MKLFDKDERIEAQQSAIETNKIVQALAESNWQKYQWKRLAYTLGVMIVAGIILAFYYSAQDTPVKKENDLQELIRATPPETLETIPNEAELRKFHKAHPELLQEYRKNKKKE